MDHTSHRIIPEICDQTLGVVCLDCNILVAVCWDGDHIPESLWNRVCARYVPAGDLVPCLQNRDDVCAICETFIDCLQGDDS
jgi:hypothetical protein